MFSFGADTGRDSFKETEIELQHCDIMVTPKKRVILDSGAIITPPCPTNQSRELDTASREPKRQVSNQNHKNGIT